MKSFSYKQAIKDGLVKVIRIFNVKPKEIKMKKEMKKEVKKEVKKDAKKDMKKEKKMVEKKMKKGKK